MPTITKRDLVHRIALKTGAKKVAARRIVQLFLDEIVSELADGNRLEFREFGVFEIKERAARQARNPRTGESVSVPVKFVVIFKPGRTMRVAAENLTLKRRKELKLSKPPSITKAKEAES